MIQDSCNDTVQFYEKKVEYSLFKNINIRQCDYKLCKWSSLNFFREDLVMKIFLQPFFLFRCF